jgi:hypothetical protein
MRATRIILTVIAAIMVLLVAIALQHPIVKSALGLAPEDRAFASVKVGDAEATLIDTLESYNVDYHKQVEGNTTFYSHVDGFMGVCIYYVVNGRISQMVKD